MTTCHLTMNPFEKNDQRQIHREIGMSGGLLVQALVREVGYSGKLPAEVSQSGDAHSAAKSALVTKTPVVLRSGAYQSSQTEQRFIRMEKQSVQYDVTRKPRARQQKS